jgi:hypothetical protein
MKLLGISLLLSLVLSPSVHADCSAASKEAALSFMNTYVKYISADDADADQWVAESQTLSTAFKTAYKKLVDDARKEDPELGLDFDPIVDGQDFVEHFDQVKQCNESSGVLIISGKWPDSKETMEVAVKPSKENDQWLIDGAGVINIPEAEQAQR